MRRGNRRLPLTVTWPDSRDWPRPDQVVWLALDTRPRRWWHTLAGILRGLR